MPIKPLVKSRRPLAAEKKPSSSALTPGGAVEVTVDFPHEGELVLPGHYAVRVSAQPGYDVEISTDGKEWSLTRPSVGFHWFDWWPSASGRTVLSARVKSGKGRWKKVSERECIVIGADNN